MPYGSSFLDVGANWGDTLLKWLFNIKNNNRSDIRFYAFIIVKKKMIVIRFISCL